MTWPSIRNSAQSLLARLSIALGASPATIQEFKWMKDHASGDLSALQGMVQRRIDGEPLQYILGTQPFGPLELKVRRPVLIPRPETEDWTLRLARLLSSSSSTSSSSSSPSPTTSREPNSNSRRIRFHQEKVDEPLKLLDLCTGTGCIPLLLCHMWAETRTRSQTRSQNAAARQTSHTSATSSSCSCTERGQAHQYQNQYRTQDRNQSHEDIRSESQRVNNARKPKNTACATRIRALGVDIADEAVDLANENAELVRSRLTQKEGDNNTGSKIIDISFRKADILADEDFPRILKELGWTGVDVLTSNPPYIPLREYERLASSVRDYEDPRALLGDPSPELGHHYHHCHESQSHFRSSHTSSKTNAFSYGTGTRKNNSPHRGLAVDNQGRGLTFYYKIASLIRDHKLVRPGGLIALEVGHDQSAEVVQIMRSHALVRGSGGGGDIEVWDDPWGVPRAVICCIK